MKIVRYNFLILCMVKLSLSKSTYKKIHDNKAIEDDTLIDRILSAGKFNELADKIVEKTIKKLNTLRSSSDPLLENIKTDPSPGFKSNIDNVNKNFNNKKESKHHKPANIDIKAVMQKKVIPIEDLRLRYEHFTKSVYKTFDSPPMKLDDIKKTPLSVEIKNTNKQTIEHKKSKKLIGNDIGKLTGRSVEGEINKSEEKLDVNKKIQAFSSENIKFTEKSTNKHELTKPKSVENEFGDEKVIVWNEHEKKSDGEASSEKSYETGQKFEVKKQATEQSHVIYNNRAVLESKPSTQLYRDENKLKYDEKPTGVQELQREHEAIKKKNRQLIRREGDKEFAFEESPDYAEYHEQLEKLSKVKDD